MLLWLFMGFSFLGALGARSISDPIKVDKVKLFNCRHTLSNLVKYSWIFDMFHSRPSECFSNNLILWHLIEGKSEYLFEDVGQLAGD